MVFQEALKFTSKSLSKKPTFTRAASWLAFRLFRQENPATLPREEPSLSARKALTIAQTSTDKLSTTTETLSSRKRILASTVHHPAGNSSEHRCPTSCGLTVVWVCTRDTFLAIRPHTAASACQAIWQKPSTAMFPMERQSSSSKPWRATERARQ